MCKFYPLSQSQLGIYLEYIQHPNLLQYTYPCYFRFSTNIDLLKLKAAIEKLLDKYPVFYTRIVEQNDHIMQYADRNLNIEIPIERVEEWEVQGLLDRFIRPFNLDQDPLTRFLIIETPKACYFVHDLSHMIFDGKMLDRMYLLIEKVYYGEELPDEEISIYEYAQSQVLEFDSEQYIAAKEYMRQKFNGVEMTKMPERISRDAGIISLCSALVPKCYISLKCEELGIKESWLFMSAFELVVGRFCIVSDVAYSTVLHGRNRKELRNLLGMMVKTTPVLAKIDNNLSVMEFITSHKEELNSIRTNDVYPFTHFCEDNNISPEISYAFQGSFVKDDREFLDEKVVRIPVMKRASAENISVLIYDNFDNYDIRVSYTDVQYPAKLIAAFTASIATVVQEMIDAPGKLLKNISIVSEEERQKLIALGTGEELVYNQNETFIDSFQKQVALYPNSTAVVDEVSSITYSDLDKQSNLLAHVLVSDGVATDTFVAVMLPRRKEFLVSVLSIFKAGGAYVPLDSDYPNDRLLYMLEDSEAKVLITTRELFNEKQKAGDFSAENIVFIDEFDFIGNCEAINHSRPNSLAYMIYTSGSTGKPKGVTIEHTGLCAFIKWLAPLEELKYGNSYIEHSSFSFDASMFDLYPPLAAGGIVHILGTSLRHDLDGIYQYITQHNIIGGIFSTQIGMELLNQYDLTLRYMVVGGEKLKPTRPSSVKVINAYGPTEFTVCSSYHIVDQSRVYQNIPIGRAVPNTISVIIDEFGNLVPQGIAGELCLIGRQIARGYWNRPELTAEKFVNCPFIEGEKMYHTGDLARWNECGELEYLGRIDTQVKISGFRIELGEVEAVICEFPDVKDVTVQAFDDQNGDKFIAAYIVSDIKISTEELNAFIALQKPSYMLPAVIMQIDKIPLTVNHKVDRKALPKLEFEQLSVNSQAFVAPQGRLEEIVADCFTQVLALTKPVSALDNFTALGGSSMKAIRMASMLQKQGLALSMAQILKLNIVRDIALGIDFSSRGEYIEHKHALLPAQVRMLNNYIYNPDSMRDRKAVIFDVDAPLTNSALRATIDKWASKHDALTSSIVYAGIDNPVRVTLSGREIPLHIVDLSLEKNPLSKMESMRTELRMGALNLQTSPLIHFLWGHGSKHGNYLLVVFHAIIAEEWRMSSWLAELFGMLANSTDNPGTLADWNDLLSMYERVVPQEDREEWIKEQGQENYFDNFSRNSNESSEDNWHIYSYHPDKKQLVFVHTGNTSSEAYISLAEKLKDDYSFALLDQYNLYHQDDPLKGILAVATKYIEVLRKHQPCGPYNIGGWCYGAVVAYEMACQLRAMGEQVDMLIMLDVYTVKNPVLKQQFINKDVVTLRDYFQNSPLFEDLLQRGLLNSLVTNSIQVQYDMAQYNPSKYDGEVLYFKALTINSSISQENKQFFKEMNAKRAGGFEEYIEQQNLHIVDITQEHDNMMNEASLNVIVPVMKQFLK